MGQFPAGNCLANKYDMLLGKLGRNLLPGCVQGVPTKGVEFYSTRNLIEVGCIEFRVEILRVRASFDLGRVTNQALIIPNVVKCPSSNKTPRLHSTSTNPSSSVGCWLLSSPPLLVGRVVDVTDGWVIVSGGCASDHSRLGMGRHVGE